MCEDKNIVAKTASSNDRRILFSILNQRGTLSTFRKGSHGFLADQDAPRGAFRN